MRSSISLVRDSAFRTVAAVGWCLLLGACLHLLRHGPPCSVSIYKPYV